MLKNFELFIENKVSTNFIPLIYPLFSMKEHLKIVRVLKYELSMPVPFVPKFPKTAVSVIWHSLAPLMRIPAASRAVLLVILEVESFRREISVT